MALSLLFAFAGVSSSRLLTKFVPGRTGAIVGITTYINRIFSGWYMCKVQVNTCNLHLAHIPTTEKGVKDVKKIATLITTVVMSIFFCTSFFIDLSASAAATEGSGGGGGHRGDYVELNRSDLDTEKTKAQINSDFISDFKDNTTESLEDLFYYALGSVGAVFSDDTTLKSVKNQYNAIYANALSSPEEMRKIFYYGTDGQLYFTDDFLSQFRSIVDENSFNQGVYTLPLCTDDSVVQEYASIGALYLTNAITSALQGNSVLLIPSLQHSNFGAYYKNSFSPGVDVSSFSLVLSFGTFSSYKNFCNPSSKSWGVYGACFYSDSSCTSSSVPFSQYSTSHSSSGFAALDDVLVNLAPLSVGSVSGKLCISHTGENGSNTAFYLFGAGNIECYSDVEHFKYYSSGGTGVIRGNTYYALDNKQDKDNIFGKDWKTYYKGLQKQYKQLAGEVAAGNKTLKEINETLSNDILDSVADVAQSVAQQTNYLKKILDEVKSISGKLTYSNVVGTVSAASNLLSAICDGLDSLFGGEDGGVFSLLDFVENYVLDGAGNTAASIMKKSFPFSLPHDFYLILELFSVDAKVPQINFSFDLKRLGLSYDFSYTANDFEKLAYMTRFFSSVGFVMVLINLTNKILKK